MAHLKVNQSALRLRVCLGFSVLFASILAVGLEARQSGHVGKEQSWTANYINHEYGYSLRIPPGLVGLSPPPPWPQHGIEIRLTQNRDAYIIANAFLSAVDYPSLDAAVDSDLQELGQRVSELQIVNRQRDRFGPLDAIRIVVRYKQADTTVIEETITAIRKAKRPEEAVLYTISLVTLEQRYRDDEKLFSSVVRSLRLRPLPK